MSVHNKSNFSLDIIDECAILLLDELGNLKSWNQSSESAIGYKANEIIGHNISILFTEDDNQNHIPEKLLYEVKENGKSSINLWGIRKDRSLFWAYIVIVAMHNSDNSIFGYSCIVHNLGAIKSQIDFDQSNLFSLINNIKDQLWSVDKNYKLLTANNSFNELIKGFTGKYIALGDNVLVPFFSNKQLNEFKNYYDRAFSGEAFTEIVYTSEPVEHWSEISFAPIKFQNEIFGAACNARDITETKQAQHQLQISERRFQSILENSTDAIAFLSREGKLDYASPSMRTLLGYTFDDAKHMDLNSIVHPTDLSKGQNALKQAMKNPGKPIKGTVCRMRHNNGTWRWIEIVVTNLLHDSNVNGIINNFRDITEQLQAEQRVEENEDDLKQVQELGAIGRWEIDLINGNVFWSEGHCRIFRLPENENNQTFEKWVSFIHPEDLANVLKKTTKDGKTIKSQNFFYKIVTKNNNVKYIHSIATKEKYSDGEIVGLHGIIIDIKETKNIEEQLRQSEYKFRTLIESSTDAVAIFSPKGEITFLSQTATKILGYCWE